MSGDTPHQASGKSSLDSGTETAPGLSGAALGRIRVYVLLGLALAGAYILGLTLWPFLPAIVTSTTMAVLVYPAYRWLLPRLKHKQAAALLLTIVVFFLVLLPAIGLALLLLDQIRGGLAWLASGADQLFAPAGAITRVFDTIVEYIGIDRTSLGTALSSQTENLVGMLAQRTIGIFTGLGGWLLQAGVALFTLYYLLCDGEQLVAHLKWLIPLDGGLSDELFAKAHEVTNATIYGSVAVAIVQGGLGGLTFWALGLPTPAVWGTLMGVLSLLPVVGAFVVWLPAAILLLIGGQIGKGIILLAIGALIISTIDNVLRAWLVGERAQLHPLIVFFSVLGGLVAFGAVGVFVGPVLFVVSLTVIELARRSLEPLTASSTANDEQGD